ncbi:oligopeptide-binding protein OppA [Gottschalkia purinilytica]|uniref:Oligopeptide-binding protein OppA n=1 Tax=Gottschalkia purinilytica TaxID=1503 RepID=A0A0L0W6R2_GOTPU|nr:peptide ABC transporter substrate-binding protein [Gottschalkia purinilytica]KNF07238.1 oligopeptide-binding protein OppA [Gottschalkia purinilytica]
MKMKKWLSLSLVAVLSLSLGLAGCGNSSGDKKSDKGKESTGKEELAEEQVLRFNWQANPPNLDPQVCKDQVSGWIINGIYEGLVRRSPNGEIKQGSGLAEKWEVSDDKLTYTFHLRDAKWSDGTPITAEDFAFAWKRALNPATASEYAYQLYHIKNGEAYNTGKIKDADQVGITVVDPKTLKVELERPTPFFLDLLAFYTYLPAQKATVEKLGDQFATAPDKMVYSGPFVVKEWKNEQKLTLEKNPNYWDAKSVKLQRIEGDMITDANALVNLYDTGDMDEMTVSVDFIDKYKDTEDYVKVPEGTVWYLQYNVENKYMKNENIRKGLSLAIDRKSHVDNVLRGAGVVAGGLTPGLIKGKDDGEFAKQRGDVLPKYDAKKAKEYFEKGLKELGITKEEFQKGTSFLAGDSTRALREAQTYQEMWKKALGVEIKIESASFKLRLDRYDRKDYTITMAGWGGDYNDPMSFMDLHLTGAPHNDAYYSNPEYDELVKTAITTADINERHDNLIKAEKILAKDMPIYPLYYEVKPHAVKPYVKGIARYPVGVDTDFKWTYILKH